MERKNKCVILLSGGLDSTTILYLAKDKDMETFPISFIYGQKHSIEITKAKKIVEELNITNHLIVNIDPKLFSNSELTSNYKGNVSLPSTYVPARNTVFLSLALAWAETIEATDIWIGSNYDDYKGYPDCRPTYFTAFQGLINMGTKPETVIKLKAPLINLNKKEIVKLAKSLGVPIDNTHSCYSNKPCGICDACKLREEALESNK